ncbi:MAG: hypothetical protein ACMUIA_08750 [bacterium]
MDHRSPVSLTAGRIETRVLRVETCKLCHRNPGKMAAFSDQAGQDGNMKAYAYMKLLALILVSLKIISDNLCL